MRKIVQWMLVIGLVFAPVVSSAPAEATTLVHTWVASNGSDSANCDRPTPCLTFAGAYGKTTAGGEITCADSGNFGGLVNITQSITINCESSISSNMFADAIQFITITGTSITVTLRGLDFDGGGFTAGVPCNSTGAGANIMFTGSGTLHLQKMTIRNLTGTDCGVQFSPSGSATLDITDCDITGNGGSGLGSGVYVQPASGVTAHVSIDHSRINNNYFVDGTSGGIINGTINDSVVSGNVTNGITLHAASSSVALLVDHTIVMGNNYGLVAGGNSAMRVRNSSVTANSVGLDAVTGASLLTYGDNSVNNNTMTDGTFTGIVNLQ